MTRRCVLFVHGFMGGPRQFDRLIAFARERGAFVAAPMLPGHGGDVSDFANASENDWQACVHGALEALRARYDGIVIVTHSMGGLLALREAADNPDKIVGVLALALPLRIRVTFSALRLWLSVGLFPRRVRHPRIAAARDACTVSGITVKNAGRLLPGALGLLRLAKRARRDIRASRVPLTVLQSPRDEIVSPASAALAQEAGATVRTLARSGHFWYAQEDIEAVENALSAMLGTDADGDAG